METLEILCITAPSGGGKETLISYLIEHYPGFFTRSISSTTRTGNDNLKDYISEKEFERRVAANLFIEYKKGYVHASYGTPKSEIERAKGEGKILVMDIDVYAALEIKKMFGNRKVCIAFIDSGDNLDVYRERILARNRQSDTNSKIEKRILEIPNEIKCGRTNTDLLILNRNNTEAFQSLAAMSIRQYFGLVGV